jgi:glycosyltransferase involved in cell wall biosynthesis
MSSSNTLDIVIPAYKARFLPALLGSLADQTSKNFRVIVSDDASPDPIGQICREFSEKLPIRYVRFDRNLGAADLAGHWNRSVELSTADWVLLPGDDDVLEATCIESFWRTRNTRSQKQSSAVFSFGVRVIDESGRVIREKQPAGVATAVEFLKKRILDEIYPMPVAYVFSRRRFTECDGFVSFDAGWHSDDATWALFGAKDGIEPIENTFVQWRVSGINISPFLNRDLSRSAEATMKFLAWLKKSRPTLVLSDGDIALLADLIGWNLYWRIADAPVGAWLSTAWRASKLLNSCHSKSLARHMFRFARERIQRGKRARQSLHGRAVQ